MPKLCINKCFNKELFEVGFVYPDSKIKALFGDETPRHFKDVDEGQQQITKITDLPAVEDRKRTYKKAKIEEEGADAE